MKNKIFISILILFLSIGKSNAQINNLKDLLRMSELSVQGMVRYYQYTWEVKPSVQDTSEKGYITERHPFVYNKEGKKQVLKKCGRVELSTGTTLWLTNFVSDDLGLLKGIIKNLPYQGFEFKSKLKNQTMYEDGNRVVIIELNKNYYSINVIVN